MIVGCLRSCYTAPCRWYPGGPIGRIRFYFARPGAQVFPLRNIFHPYSQVKQLVNSGVGEITGPGLRVYDKGRNRSNLDGTHYEGTPADFLGEGTPP